VISFRYHVVSLVAVLFALAAGIVLGSGPLQRDDGEVVTGSTDAEALTAAEVRLGQLDELVRFSDDYARATAPRMLRGDLEGRAVTVVTLPGADEETVGNLEEMVQLAGGEVTARFRLGEELLDAGNRQLVTELGAQMEDSVSRTVEVPTGVGGYERMGLLLAHAVSTARPRGEPVDSAGESILAGSATADLMTVQGDLDRRGSLVLVVAGEPYGTDDERAGAGTIVSSLLAAVDSRSGGVVLAGPVAAGAEDGVVGALRADPVAADGVSTVDVAARVAGGVVSALALAGQAAGSTGHYGSGDAADGALPAPAG
jgi:hypothetical protein